jgi:hypothetical protein
LRAALEKVSAGVGGLGRRLWDRVRIVDTTGAATFSDVMLQTLVAAGVAISLGAGTSPVIEPARNVLVATAARPDPAHELAVHRAFLGDLADPSAARVARSAPVRISSHETDTPPTWTPVSVNGQGVTMNQPDATAEVGGNGARVHVEDDAAGQHVESSPDATYTPPNCRVGADLEGPSTDCDEVKP